MTEFKVHPSLSGPRGKKILGIVAGTCVLSYIAMTGVKRNVQEKDGNVAIHKLERGSNYITTDALSAVARPAKNANVKGSMPTASHWV